MGSLDPFPLSSDDENDFSAAENYQQISFPLLSSLLYSSRPKSFLLIIVCIALCLQNRELQEEEERERESSALYLELLFPHPPPHILPPFKGSTSQCLPQVSLHSSWGER